VSLYRQSGRTSTRVVVIAAATAVVIGLIAGFAIGRVSAPDPSLADKVGELRTALEPADQGLELTATEYSQAVRDGRVAEPTEYTAAKADVQRVQDVIAATRADLRALDPAGAAALASAVQALSDDVDRRADPSAVQARSDAARRALRELSQR
jgi:hypothetical protein